MKRISALLLAAVLMVSLVACNSGGGGGSTSTTPPADSADSGESADAGDEGDSGSEAPAAPAEGAVTVWCWDPAFNLAAMNTAAKYYNAENPDVAIDVQEVKWDDIQTRLITAFSSNDLSTLPDIALMQNMAARKNISLFGEFFADLTGKIDYDNFAPYVVNFSTYEGKNYGVPFDSGTTGFFVRTDYLEEAGMTLDDFNDITWDEFIEKGVQFKDATGKYLLSIQTGYADILDTMMSSSGNWYFEDDETPYIVGNPALEESMKKIVALRNSGIVLEGSSWDEYIAGFNNGSAAGTIQGVWIVGSIKLAEDQAGNWGVAETPKMDLPGATTAGTQGGSSWYVLDHSDVKDVAIDFLANTFGSNVDFYGEILSDTGAVATYIPAAAAPAYAAPDEFFGGQPIFAEILAQSAKVPRFDYGTYVYEARDALAAFLIEANSDEDIAGVLERAENQALTQMR